MIKIMRIAAASRRKGSNDRKKEKKEEAAVKKKIAAWVLCLLTVFQLAAPPSAKAGDYVYFVAVGENILPLSEKTMPFWSGGYLYIASSVITGNVRDTLGISCVRNNNEKRVVLYSREEAESLFFEWEKNYATDKEGNTYPQGAIYKNGEVFIPAALVARLFNLQYSVTSINTTVDGESLRGDLVWLRRPGHVLSASVFADAALSGAIPERYSEYLKEQRAQETPETPESSGVEVDGKKIYLCMNAGDHTATLLNLLDQYRSQAAFFCTPEFLETQGDLLRRMTATGHAIGILVDAGDPECSLEEQLRAGNRALEQATFTKTRLVQVENGDEQSFRTVREAGYRFLEPDLNRTGYQLQGVAGANSLLRSISNRRGDVTVWLGDTAGAGGLRAFLAAAGNAEGQCLAWTETA